MATHSSLFAAYLEHRGLKLTAPRRAILDAVFALHEHFDAERLHQALQNANQAISLATVYRTLPLLAEAGLIQVSLRSSSRDVFEHIYGHPRHIHWVCEACGQVQESSLAVLNPVLNREAAKLKFGTLEINVQVKGRCWKCQNVENEKQ